MILYLVARMPSKRAVTARAAAVALAAVTLAGCGAVRLQPTTPAGASQLASRGRVDSPVTDVDNHLGCMRAADLPVQVVSPTKVQVGAAPSGPTIVFTPTPGAAQAAQLDGSAQGAMVIGTALVYPNQGSDGELGSISSLPRAGRAGLGLRCASGAAEAFRRAPLECTRDARARCAGLSTSAAAVRNLRAQRRVDLPVRCPFPLQS